MTWLMPHQHSRPESAKRTAITQRLPERPAFSIFRLSKKA